MATREEILTALELAGVPRRERDAYADELETFNSPGAILTNVKVGPKGAVSGQFDPPPNPRIRFKARIRKGKSGREKVRVMAREVKP